jgi:hypothetical protein
MDSTFGLVGNGYVLLAADATAARSILVFKHDEDKVFQHCVLERRLEFMIDFLLAFRFANLILAK